MKGQCISSALSFAAAGLPAAVTLVGRSSTSSSLDARGTTQIDLHEQSSPPEARLNSQSSQKEIEL
jgi:hypothetical protein